MHKIELPDDYAIVLQQVDEVGREDFTTLSESIGFDSDRLAHIVRSLKNKGLVKISHTAHDSWITLSSKGRRLVEALWPEARMKYGY